MNENNINTSVYTCRSSEINTNFKLKFRLQRKQNTKNGFFDIATRG